MKRQLKFRSGAGADQKGKFPLGKDTTLEGYGGTD